MKNALLYCVSALLLSWMPCQTPASAQIQDGPMINFNRWDLTLDEILSQVQTSGKTGMLYFTSDWCAPCKLLQKEVFSDEFVMAFVEEHFLPFWIDNHNKQNGTLSEHYDISAVPSMVFIHGNGEVIDKMGGYDGPEKYKAGLSKVVNREDTIESMREKYLENTEDAIACAEKLFRSRDYKKVIPVYKDLIHREIEDTEKRTWAHLNLATAYERTHRPDEAVNTIHQAIDKGLLNDLPNAWLQAYTRLGEIYYRQRKYEDCIKAIQKLRSNLPTRREVEGAPQERLDATNYAHDATVWLPFAFAYSGQIEKGLQHLQEIAAAAEADSAFGMLAILTYRSLENGYYTAELLPWARKSVEMCNWNDGWSLDSYAWLAANQGAYDEAIRAHQAILDAPLDNRKNIDARQKFAARANLAAIYTKTGRELEGQALFVDLLREAEQDERNQTLFMNSLAESHIRERVRLSELLPVFKQRVETIDRSDRYIMYVFSLYADLNFELGRIEEAVEYGTIALDLASRFISNSNFENKLAKYQAAIQ